MNNTEQYLQKFKLKAPSPDLKGSVVESAEDHWLKQDIGNISTGMTTAIKIVYYSAAAVVILMLAIAFFDMPKQKNKLNLDSKELSLLEDIGFSKEAAIQIISLEKPKAYSKNINLKILMKEI